MKAMFIIVLQASVIVPQVTGVTKRIKKRVLLKHKTTENNKIIDTNDKETIDCEKDNNETINMKRKMTKISRFKLLFWKFLQEYRSFASNDKQDQWLTHKEEEIIKDLLHVLYKANTSWLLFNNKRLCFLKVFLMCIKLSLLYDPLNTDNNTSINDTNINQPQSIDTKLNGLLWCINYLQREYLEQQKNNPLLKQEDLIQQTKDQLFFVINCLFSEENTIQQYNKYKYLHKSQKKQDKLALQTELKSLKNKLKFYIDSSMDMLPGILIRKEQQKKQALQVSQKRFYDKIKTAMISDGIKPRGHHRPMKSEQHLPTLKDYLNKLRKNKQIKSRKKHKQNKVSKKLNKKNLLKKNTSANRNNTENTLQSMVQLGNCPCILQGNYKIAPIKFRSRRPGRPKGSYKIKKIPTETSQPRPRGRPKGSGKKQQTFLEILPRRPRGRPKGSYKIKKDTHVSLYNTRSNIEELPITTDINGTNEDLMDCETNSNNQKLILQLDNFNNYLNQFGKQQELLQQNRNILSPQNNVLSDEKLHESQQDEIELIHAMETYLKKL